MGFALQLSTIANRRRRGDLPPEVVAAVTTAITDAVGVAIAGAAEPSTRKLADALGKLMPGPCLRIGTPDRIHSEQAVLLNAAAIHALDFDDSSQVSGAHPSATLLPAVLALGEELDTSGGTLVDAYVTGFDVMTRLARAVMPNHYELGWHPTSTLGVFGAAAAAARMLGLDDRHFATALSIAASLSSGIKSNFGTDTKPLHAAFACRSGVFAARLSLAGESASENAFEHKQGYFQVYHGADVCEPEAALREYELLSLFTKPGMAIKQYPCCGSTHSIVDAARKLRARHGPIDLDRVEEIDISMHSSRLAHTDRPDPKTETDAKFSVQYVAARALSDGEIRLEHFRGNAYQSADILSLTRKIKATGHFGPESFLGKLTVKLTNGDVLHGEGSVRFGRDSLNPMSEAELYGKFEDCIHQAFPCKDAAPLFARLLALGTVNSVRALTAKVGALATV